MSGSFDSRSSRSDTSPSNWLPDRLDMRRKRVEQLGAVGIAVEPRDRFERRRIGRQPMLLPVVDHLDAVLGGAERAIGVGDARAPHPPPAGPAAASAVQRIERRRRAQRRLAAAVDQLLDLGEEFGLADAAPAALQIIAGAERLALRIMVADAERDVADLLDRAEIERAPPDERADFVEEGLAQRRYRPPPPGRG